MTVRLNVHPMGSDQMQALPEGQRKVKHLEAHGTDVIRAADEATHTRGDFLRYYGAWYECTAAQPWDHTLLSHINYQFVLVPEDGAGEVNLTPPANETEEGEDEGE